MCPLLLLFCCHRSGTFAQINQMRIEVSFYAKFLVVNKGNGTWLNNFVDNKINVASVIQLVCSVAYLLK